MNYDPNDESHFLNQLPLMASDRKRLGALGDNSAFGLLMRRKANPDDFDKYVGPERSGDIVAALRASLSEQERAALQGPSPVPRRTGARLDAPPGKEDTD